MPEQQVFPRQIAALDDIFTFLEVFIDRHRIDDDTGFAIRFAAEELFTNMVKYNKGTSHGIALAVAIDEAGQLVRLELVDSGVDPFDPSALEPVNVDAPLEERVPGGLGLHLVRALVDDLSYDYADREMKVTVVKRLPIADG
ncbi:MAG TPA: ATP-binding protein [Thermoanaerobaculia bacterium]|nr:ATP-binding protein [Thermoanaerobaculia bacterium]